MLPPKVLSFPTSVSICIATDPDELRDESFPFVKSLMIAATLPTNKDRSLINQSGWLRVIWFSIALVVAFGWSQGCFGKAVWAQDRASSSKSPKPDAWVMPESLIQELEKLKSSPYTAAWAETTIQVISGLETLEGIGDPDSKLVFGQLSQQIKKLDFIVKQLVESDAVSTKSRNDIVAILRQIRYSIGRRLAIWPIVNRIAMQERGSRRNTIQQQAGPFLLASSSRLSTSSVERGWADYLEINEAADVFNSLNATDLEKRKAARVVLARAYNPALSISQKKYLANSIDKKTLEVLMASAVGPLEMQQFLKRLEKLESRDLGANRYRLNDYYQSALWSRDPQIRQLANELQKHYRNGNFRVSIHEELLNRMVPPFPETQQPYRDEILGAQVQGQTRISNSLHVGLIPDPNQISMRLESHGKVRSRTTATRSGVVIENEGDSRFRIIKRLALGQHGVFAYRPETTAQVRQRVVGLRTNLDNIPPLGWMVRRIARNKIEQQAPITNRYTKNQLEQEAETRFETEVQTRLNELETLLTERLLHPLVALDLEPDPVQISTTENQIVMRYRLGGRDQMAASTARPREIPDSLMSMQIHQSAINNVIARFGFGGKKFTTEELIEYVNQMFQTEFVSAGQQHKPANFEFLKVDPIRIDFDGGKVGISINLKSFQVGKGKTWKRLAVRATYDAQIENGFTVRLIQTEDGLNLSGRRLNPADQIAIRVICDVFFPEEFAVKLMPEHLGSQLNVNTLQATQFVLSNGWIAISVDDSGRNRGQTTPQQRQTRRFLDRWRQQ